MTTFIVVCAVMVAAALLWLLVPLFRTAPAADAPPKPREKRLAAAAVALLVPAVAVTMYSTLSDWDFDALAAQSTETKEMDDLLAAMEARLKSNPTDVDGWMLLGRSYLTTGRYAEAVNAFEHAHAAANGSNVDATINLAEALTLVDQTALGGRAGELAENALARAPNHPKALWYGALAALHTGNLSAGRDRFQQLLAQNPPEEVRNVIERQLQDLNQQLGETGDGAQLASAARASPAAQAPATASAPAAATASRSVKVTVSIAPVIQKQLPGPLPLFIAVREPAGGPPLAAQRRSSAEAPLTVTLTERDAMMPTRTIASAQQVQVVARLSKTGAPQAQSGDYFGQAEYDFSKGAAASLKIVIDRVVP